MYNTDPSWQQQISLFEQARTGEEVRSQLIACLNMLYYSHAENVRRGDIPVPPVPPNPDDPITPPTPDPDDPDIPITP